MTVNTSPRRWPDLRSLRASRDVVAGVVIAVLGLVYTASALQIRPDSSAASVLGPRVAPLTIGILTVACALVLVARGIRSPSEDADAEPTDPGRRRQVLVVFGMLTAYVVAFIPIGFVISTVGFLVALSTYVDREKVLRNCVFAVVFACAVYALFSYGLEVRLPPGLLG